MQNLKNMQNLVIILVVILTVIYAAFVGVDLATNNGKDLIVDGIMLVFLLIFLGYIIFDLKRDIRHLKKHLLAHHDRIARDAMKDFSKILGDVFKPKQTKTPSKVNLAKAQGPVKKQQSKGTRKVAQDGNKKA